MMITIVRLLIKFTCCFKHCLFAVVYSHHVQSICMTNTSLIGKNMVSKLLFVSSFKPTVMTKMPNPSMNKVYMLF